MLKSHLQNLSDVSVSSLVNSSSSGEESMSNEHVGRVTNSLTGRLWMHVAEFRLRYLFRQSCSVFCKSVGLRIPTGKQVYAILFMLGMEQIAYAAASDFLVYPFLSKVGVGTQYLNLVRSSVIYIVANMLFPLMGWISDVYVGQYNMVHFSLWLLWVAYILLAVLYSISDFAVGQWNLYMLPVIFAAISLGHAGFQASAIPFGANSIMYRTSQELSSYFYCYYWVRNFSFILYIVSNRCTSIDQDIQAEVYVMIAVFCITLALCLNACFRRQIVVHAVSPPYKKLVQVLYLALVIKRPVHRSAFSFSGAKPPSRINLAKRVHGGKYTSEEVEDVKTFLRLLVVLAFILCCLVLYNGTLNAMLFQLYDVNATSLNLQISMGKLGACKVAEKIPLAANVTLILVLIPIVNSVLYPFLREYVPNMMKRIGFGTLLLLLSVLASLVISAVGNAGNRPRDQCMLATNFTNFTDTAAHQAYSYSHVSEYFVLIPLILVTLAEMFINITSLEFFYAQSPHTMRGMMVGLFFFTWGLASLITQLLITGFNLRKNWSPMTCDFWYYLFHLCLAIGGCVGYVLLARWYRNRQRGEQESERFYRPQLNPGNVTLSYS